MSTAVAPGFWATLLTLSVPSLLALGAARRARRSASRAEVGRRLGPVRPRLGHEPRPIPGWLGRPIERAALGAAPSRIVALWVGAILLAAVAGAVTGVIALGLLAAVGVAVIPAGVLWFLRHRRDRLIESELPAALEAIGRSVRSGASFPQAFAEAATAVRGPLAADLADLDRRLGLGQPFGQVLREWMQRRELPGIRLASAALGFSSESGGSRSRAIDGLADSLRDRAALDREITALASQARMSGVVIAVLPVGFVFVSSTLDPEVSAFLFASTAGLVCLALGIGLDVIGFVWMHRMSTSIDGAAT